MTFAIRNLSVLAYAQGFTLWHYKAPSVPLSSIQSPGFFNSVADMLDPGDHILISAADGGSSAYVQAAAEATGVVLQPLQPWPMP